MDRVGLHDNLVELGGHSLLMQMVQTRILAKWEVELPMPSLFAGQPLADLASAVPLAHLAIYSPADVERVLSEMSSVSEEDMHAMLKDED